MSGSRSVAIAHSLAALLLFGGIASAANPCNTGHATGACTSALIVPNPVTGGPNVDGHWDLALPDPSAPSSSPITNPCALTGFHAAWVDQPNTLFSNWSSDGPNSEWINPKIEDFKGGYYVYRTKFHTPNHTTITVAGQLQSDNETLAIYLDDPSATHCAKVFPSGPGFVNIPGAVSDFTTWTPFNFTSAITPLSTAAIYVVVRNRGIHGIDSKHTPAGLRVEFTTVRYHSPVFVGAGHLNGDAALDLGLADSGLNQVSVLRGNGNGTFQSAIAFPVGTDPVFIAGGDFNKDGQLDLAVANAGVTGVSGAIPGGAVSILIANDAAVFQPAVNYPVGTGPVCIRSGDFNGDGNLDLAVANAGSADISILLGNGDGTFKPAVTFAVGKPPVSALASLVVGDFNKDGKADLAVTDAGLDTVDILLGNGDGTFQAPVSYPTGTTPQQVIVADFNGDGAADLAIANAGSSDVTVMLGNGNGTFQKGLSVAAGSTPQSVAAADFNADGIPDLVVANAGSNTVTILLGAGKGTFQAPVSYPVGTNPQFVATGDFNGDGATDLVTADTGSDAVSVLLGNGDGTFGAGVSYPAVTGRVPLK